MAQLWMRVPGLLAVLALASAPLAASAQRRAGSEVRANLVATLVYQAASTNNALARKANAESLSFRRQITATEASLAKARGELQVERARSGRNARALQTRIDRLEKDAVALKRSIAAQLAARDEDYARERALLLTAGETLSETLLGQQALQTYNRGDDGAYDSADLILSQQQEAREKIREERVRMERAADFRTRAALALDARDKGRTTTAKAIALYEQTVANDATQHWDWIELSRLYRDAGKLDEAKRASQTALDTARSDRDKFAARLELLEVNVERNELESAHAGYEEVLTSARRAAANDNVTHRDLSVVLVKSGDVLTQRGDAPGALGRYQEALELRRALAEAEPGTPGPRRDLSLALLKLGEMARAKGDLAGATRHYDEALVLVRALAAADSASAIFQRDNSLVLSRIGDLLVAQMALPRALQLYQEALDIDRRLAAADPRSAVLQRNLAISLDRIGTLLLVGDDLVGALVYYRQGLDIDRSLAAAEPTSATHQRDVSIALAKIGDVALRRKDWSGALQSYTEGLTIQSRLSDAEPASVSLRRDVAMSRNRMGDVLQAQNDAPGASAHYKQALDVFRALAKAQPDSAALQSDIARSLWRLASVKAKGFSWGAVAAQYDRMRAAGMADAIDDASATMARALAAAEARP